MKKKKTIEIQTSTLGWLVLIIFFVWIFWSVEDVSSPIPLEYPLLEQSAKFIQDDFSNVEFPHFTKLPITYKLIDEKYCGTTETHRIKRGFDQIENATEGIVYFEKIENGSADIDFSCSFIEDCYEIHYDHQTYYSIITETICAHDLGYALISEIEENRILKGEIEMVGLDGFAETDRKGMSGFVIGRCGYPEVEIHEILHVFGFEHISNPSSIMNPYVERSRGYKVHKKGECDNTINSIDTKISSCLKYIYSNGNSTLGNKQDCIDEEEAIYNYGCPEGSYEVGGTDYCCPEPNMIIDEEGYCA